MISESELEVIKRAESHLETLHSLVLSAGGRQSNAVKIVWRDIKELRQFIKAHGG